MDTVLALVVIALCSFFIYRIGMALQSAAVLLVAFSGCTVAMVIGLGVTVIQYRESRA